MTSDRTEAWLPPPRRPPVVGPYTGFGRRLLVAAAIGLLFFVGEIALVVVIAGQIGWAWTLLLMFTTSLLGAWVLRREGPRSWQALRADLRERRPPGPSVTDGLVALVGGVLMVLPGFVSDVIGAALVAPPTRKVAARWAQELITRRLTPAAATSFFGPRVVKVRIRRPDAADR